ncbi:MAG: tetratricopeptide repeat protein [Armatimonadetes bacterium]|nr:tetratricopeptide repeat protein [Armatimonadota bacterium]
MVTCTHCNTKNSIDSHFCKSCGKELEKAAIDQAQTDQAGLVAEGYRKFNDGKVMEACLIAEAVLEEDPGSVAALSLKAMCREHEGQLAEALELFERVVSLKPDSALDKIKVTHLRSLIAAKLQTAPPAPDRRTAIIGALAATVLVVSVGIALAGFLNPGGEVASNSGKGGTDSQTPVNSSPPIQNPADPNAAGASPGTANPSDGAQAPGGAGAPGTGGGAAPGPLTNPGDSPPGIGDNSSVPPLGIGIRPDAGIGRGTDQGTRPNQGGGGGGGANSNPGGGNSGGDSQPDGPDPVVGGGNARGGSSSTGKPAVYEINVSGSGGQGNSGGSTGGNDSMTADTLFRTGLRQFQLGDYQGAARNFQGALKAGADPGRTNQRLAQCYQNLGQTADAISAYTRAISALEGAIKSGKGSAGTQSALDACKAALQVLKGSD